MTAGQLDAALAGKPTVPTQAFGQAAFEQLRVAQAAYAVGQHAGKRQVGLIARQTQGQGAKGLGHGSAVDHRQHRHAEMPRQIGRASCRERV